MKFEQSVTKLIRERRSVRNYSSRKIEPVTKEKIQEVLASHTSGPMGSPISFQHVEKQTSQKGQKVRIGTYGFIKGAQYFIAGEMQPGTYAEVDYGYLLEKTILHLWEMELGTCWLGGTFKRSEIFEILGNSDETIIPAITPVGYPAASMSGREKLIRRGAKSDHRKPWKELFFEKEFKSPLQMKEGNDFFTPLEMVRLAPSASNKQPWRVVLDGDQFHFFLERTPGYGKFVKSVDLQRIDIGIAMAHFDLSCREAGIDRIWELNVPEIVAPDNTEFIVSSVSKR